MHFEHIPLVDDFKSLFHIDFFLRLEAGGVAIELGISRLWVLVVEEVLGDLHPELLLDLVL